MEFLGRDSAPIASELWEKIDSAVVETARKLLIGRRFLSLAGPLGAGAQSVILDTADMAEVLENGTGLIENRRFLPLIQLYEDFSLLWRDLETTEQGGELDRSRIITAARKLALREDELIFNGNAAAGTAGLATVKGAVQLKRSSWKESENAFTDLAAGVTQLEEKGMVSGYALILSPDLALDLQRIQPGTGMLEIDRIARLIDGPILKSSVLGKGKALLVSAEAENMDLALGVDCTAGYLETKDFNHVFRILETAALRIKRPDAIVQFN